MNLATGTTPAMPERAPLEADPFAHPDAQRRFRVLTNIEELERALDYPWEKWAVFLHPAQRRLVERDYNGPARISGIVPALARRSWHCIGRLPWPARHPQARVLLTTFSKALANALRIRLRTLTGNEPEIAARIAVHPVTRDWVRPLHGGVRSAEHRPARADRGVAAPSRRARSRGTASRRGF